MSLIYNEIKDQYTAMEKCAAYLEQQFPAVEALIHKSDPSMVIFMGCGSSFSLAKSMADTVNMRTKAHAYALPAGDAALHAGRYAGMAQGALIVPVSRSGPARRGMQLYCAQPVLRQGLRPLQAERSVSGDALVL